MMDLEQIGYFLYMESKEKEQAEMLAPMTDESNAYGNAETPAQKFFLGNAYENTEA